MLIWKTCEATNCRKEFYVFEENQDMNICWSCIEVLASLNASNFGPPVMTLDEYQALVEDYFNNEDPDKE